MVSHQLNNSLPISPFGFCIFILLNQKIRYKFFALFAFKVTGRHFAAFSFSKGTSLCIPNEKTQFVRNEIVN